MQQYVSKNQLTTKRREETGRVGRSSNELRSPGALRVAEQRRRQNQAEIKAIQEELFKKSREKFKLGKDRKPIGYERPSYNTPQYWRDCAQGWITDEQQQNDYADFESRRRRAVDSKHNKAPAPHRHMRSAPFASKQFSKPMSTQSARDDRLTPQSKALLQVLLARTGRGRSTDTTKTTLGKVMNRCPRSIQRYIQELIKFGYIRTQVMKSKRTGFYVGLRIWVMNSVLPFFAQKNPKYDPSKWQKLGMNGGKSEETKESLTNIKDSISSALSPNKPPWHAQFAMELSGLTN